MTVALTQNASLSSFAILTLLLAPPTERDIRIINTTSCPRCTPVIRAGIRDNRLPIRMQKSNIVPVSIYTGLSTSDTIAPLLTKFEDGINPHSASFFIWLKYLDADDSSGICSPSPRHLLCNQCCTFSFSQRHSRATIANIQILQEKCSRQARSITSMILFTYGYQVLR
ncbi:hypothetical protein F4604DRAFT_1816761 [Suillus subluteus]|nr:hypothetical protein F4604DRAFT_1816761 [Suillus subluteus]